jgi:hypothetical protein
MENAGLDPFAKCPLCDQGFLATSALVCNVDLYEHMLKAHPGLQRDDLDKAFAEAERNFPHESESPPSIWKDRIPPTPVSKEPSDCYYFTAVCPECDTKLVEMRSGTLVEMALAHVANRHSDLSPELRTQLCIAITDDRVLHRGTSHEPEEALDPGVSTKPAPAPAKQATASTYVFTCPVCDTLMGAQTYKDLVKSVEQHLSHKHITSLPDVKRISDEFYAGLPEDYCVHLLGYTLARTDDPENPTVPLDLTIPRNPWNLDGAVKPPIGLQPEYRWREQRMYELIACINRYHESGFPVKPEWLEELRRLLVDSHFLSVLKETL